MTKITQEIWDKVSNYENKERLNEGVVTPPTPQRGPTDTEMDKVAEKVGKKHPGHKVSGVAVDPDGTINYSAQSVVSGVVEERQEFEVNEGKFWKSTVFGTHRATMKIKHHRDLANLYRDAGMDDKADHHDKTADKLENTWADAQIRKMDD